MDCFCDSYTSIVSKYSSAFNVNGNKQKIQIGIQNQQDCCTDRQLNEVCLGCFLELETEHVSCILQYWSIQLLQKKKIQKCYCTCVNKRAAASLLTSSAKLEEMSYAPLKKKSSWQPPTPIVKFAPTHKSNYKGVWLNQYVCRRNH